MAPRVVLVTDPAFDDDAIVRCVTLVAAALPPGALAVQLRDKHRATTSLRLFAMRLRRVTREAGAWLVVNGSAQVARDSDAEGSHLGDGAGTVAEARAFARRPIWVSVPAHSDADVTRARGDRMDRGGADRADAVLVSPIFATRPLASLALAKVPRGVAALRSARALAGPGLLVYALGGVTPDTAPICAASGAHGVAVIRALLASPDPAAAARGLYRAFSPP